MFIGNQPAVYGTPSFHPLKNKRNKRSGSSVAPNFKDMVSKTKRAYAYANLTAREAEKLDEIAEILGYTSRTHLYTAIAHILLYGDAAELILQNKRKTETAERMQTFFAILDEIAFPIIAMRGIAPVYTFLLDDIRRELFSRTNSVPADETLKHWLKIYVNINRTRIDEYCDEVRRRQYLEEQEASA